MFDITDTETRPLVGGSVLWIGSLAGFELDLGDAPEFFASKRGQAVDRSNALTLMGNAVVQFPTASSRIRPYAVDGIGLIHTKVTPLGNGFEIDEPSFGFNVGGGLIVFLNERVGLRGDFGYFRTSRNDDATVEADALGVSELKFLRGTIGVTLKF